MALMIPEGNIYSSQTAQCAAVAMSFLNQGWVRADDLYVPSNLMILLFGGRRGTCQIFEIYSMSKAGSLFQKVNQLTEAQENDKQGHRASMLSPKGPPHVVSNYTGKVDVLVAQIYCS